MEELISSVDIHQMFNGKKIVVLGAAGYIGRWVARRLSQFNARLWLVVRDRSAAEVIFSQYGRNGEIITLDLTDFSKVTNFINSVQPQATFNLAGYGIDRSEKDPTSSYQINTELVSVLCQAIAKFSGRGWSGKDIIHVGSVLEYGPIGGNNSF